MLESSPKRPTLAVIKLVADELPRRKWQLLTQQPVHDGPLLARERFLSAGFDRENADDRHASLGHQDTATRPCHPLRHGREALVCLAQAHGLSNVHRMHSEYVLHEYRTNSLARERHGGRRRLALPNHTLPPSG